MGRAFSPEGALVLACFLGLYPSWGCTPPGAAPQAVMERAFGPWGFVGVDAFLGLHPSWGFTPGCDGAGLWPLGVRGGGCVPWGFTPPGASPLLGLHPSWGFTPGCDGGGPLALGLVVG